MTPTKITKRERKRKKKIDKMEIINNNNKKERIMEENESPSSLSSGLMIGDDMMNLDDDDDDDAMKNDEVGYIMGDLEIGGGGLGGGLGGGSRKCDPEYKDKAFNDDKSSLSSSSSIILNKIDGVMGPYGHKHHQQQYQHQQGKKRENEKKMKRKRDENIINIKYNNNNNNNNLKYFEINDGFNPSQAKERERNKEKERERMKEKVRKKEKRNKINRGNEKEMMDEYGDGSSSDDDVDIIEKDANASSPITTSNNQDIASYIDAPKDEMVVGSFNPTTNQGSPPDPPPDPPPTAAPTATPPTATITTSGGVANHSQTQN